MKFIILLALFFLFNLSPFLGAIAGLAYLYYLFSANKLETSTKNHINSKDSWGRWQLDTGDLADLMILRLEIDRLFKTKILSQDKAEAYKKQIDQIIEQYFTGISAKPGNPLWKKRREEAWALLARYSDMELEDPPWGNEINLADEDEEDSKVLPIKAENITQTEVQLKDSLSPEPAIDKYPQESSTQTSNIESFPPKQKTPPLPVSEPNQTSALSLQTRQLQETLIEKKEEKPIKTINKQGIHDYAWQPQEPGYWEKTLAKFSGWHSLAAPFLLQNIGWFIGVFCFIAGSIFLVSYSTGYTKNFLAFITLFFFTLFTLWGGYQIRKKRPELQTSSHVIFIISMLLIPLTTTSSVGLIISSEKTSLMILSGLVIGLELGAFYYAVTLVSALMDKSLQNRLPVFFLVLSFSQLLLIVLELFPYWPVLIFTHLLVFSFLSYGIHCFINDWLHSILIERRKIAYFVAGTLIYAALIAFINLTWGIEQEINLPSGYSGLFIILLCGLLFYVDSHFKQWTRHYSNLSRFSFFVYSLSLLALFLVFPQQSTTITTLCLAIGLYSFVVWNYLTLIPLYILLLCCFWLYGLLILQHFTPALHLITASPGLFGLYKLAKWALKKKRSQHLAIIIYRMLYASLTVLIVWSLFYNQQGWLGLINSLFACGLTYLALKSAPVWLLSFHAKLDEPPHFEPYNNLLLTPWFYSIPLLVVIAVYFAPLIPALQASAQFALGLLFAAIFWIYKGLKAFNESSSTSKVTGIEMCLNSALLYLLLSSLSISNLNVLLQVFCLVIMGGLLLWLSLKLLIQWMLYLTLVAWGLSGMLIKSTYFPAPSTGLIEMLVAFSLWVLLWWLERPSNDYIVELQRQATEVKADLLPSFKLFWFWPVNAKQQRNQHD